MLTKACNLTEDEISALISIHGEFLAKRDFTDNNIDRIDYLNKRLKAFKEPETEIKSSNSAAGWGAENNG